MITDRCPLCGEANDCHLAAGLSTCWCFSSPIPPSVLARLPAGDPAVACICKRCASDPSGSDLRRRLAMRWTKR